MRSIKKKTVLHIPVRDKEIKYWEDMAKKLKAKDFTAFIRELSILRSTLPAVPRTRSGKSS